MAGIFENNNSEDLTMKSIKRMIWLSLLLLLGTSVQAATYTIEYTDSFGTDPVGVYPTATAVFEETATDEVTLTFSVEEIGVADITEIYFNIDSDLISTLDIVSITTADTTVLNDPTITCDPTDPSCTVPTLDEMVSLNTFQADGDGIYDIFINLDTSDPLSSGEELIIVFTADGLTADSFDYWSEPGGGEGPYISVVKVQSTDSVADPAEDTDGSDWVGAVPVPAAAWLFGSALLGLVGVARRRS
jgi:hypothetical protein